MKVVVLVGGTGREAQLSQAYGQQVAEALEAAEHKVVLLEVAEDLTASLRREKPDMVVVAIPGCTGSNGEIQALLEFLDIPFVGSASRVCRKAFDKSMVADVLGTYHELTEDELAATCPVSFVVTRQMFESMGAKDAVDLFDDRVPGGYPLCVKPAQGAFAQGVRKVENESQLVAALGNIFETGDCAVVQQWIDGLEVSVCMLGEDWDAYALPPVEISVKDGWFDEESRKDGADVELISPVRNESLSPVESMAQAIRAEIERAAFEAYCAFGIRDFGRIDVVWDGAQAHVIDVEVNPDLGEGSIFRIALDTADISLKNVMNAMVGGIQY